MKWWPRRARADPDAGSKSVNLRRRAVICLTIGLVVLIGGYIAATVYAAPRSPGNELRYDQFLDDLRSDRVQSATILSVDKRIIGSYDGGQYWIDYGSSDSSPLFASLLSALQQTSVPVSTDQQWFKGLLVGPQVSVLLPSLILVDALVLALLAVQGGGLLGFARSGSRRVRTDEATIRFADVAGVDEAVEELVEVRDFLRTPERFLAMGARVPRGILLIGPPGCGKTLLAKAVAGEAGAPFFSISGSAFVELYVGVGAARIRDLFREAQQTAPAIVFIDELDAVGRGRSGAAIAGQDERESTLNQLLVELDGFGTGSGVVVIAATNRPDVLDPALLRPGRFDRRIVVEPPDVVGRRGILRVHTRDKPLADDVELEQLARNTPGFSGADLAAVVNEAALLAARRGDARISASLLREATERVIAGPERRSRLLGQREKRLLAAHEAGHALVAVRLDQPSRVTKISLIRRGHGGGFTWVLPEEEAQVLTRDDLSARITMLMGGRAAEELLEGQTTSSSRDDLQHATELARRMVGEFGMGRRFGPLSLRGASAWAELQGHATGRPSEEVAALADEEVRDLLSESEATARSLLEQHRAALERLAAALLEAETLEGEQLERLLSPFGLVVTPPAARGPQAPPASYPT